MAFNQTVLARALITTAMILFAFVVDPLGVRNAAEKHYEDHILRLWSPFYSEEVSQEIAVILIDDTFLRQTEKYPVTYRNLSNILKVISAHKPKAVFFDILQHYEHSPRLDRWLKTLDSQNFPVFMSSDTDYDTESILNDETSLRYKISQVSQLTAVSWSGYQHYYPLYVDWNGSKSETAAMSLYQAWCTAEKGRCSDSLQDPIKSFIEPMMVQWTNKFDSQQNSYFPLSHECGQVSSSQFSQFWDLLNLSLTQGVQTDEALDEGLRQRCPPFLSISAAKLFESGSLKSEALSKAIQNRLVLVGYYLPGGTDIVRSPVHGSLPGVYYHAMALDNLINIDTDYWHVPEKIGFFSLSLADLIEIIVQVGVLFLVIWYRYTHLENELTDGETLNSRSQIYSGIKPTLCIIVLIMASVLVCHFILKVGAPNWYGLLMILFLDLPIFLFYFLEAVKKFAINKASHIREKVICYIHSIKTLNNR
ncbi:CHASE2 domain-containing protein (plasmid) [Photobacterium sp. DA100]|uniref:CHASE2 domain-containing protein n=1 Tax=Photobacterium sp. DA100 TaxID=3027472 RepID=UPI00247AF777|nr:CHASE2 domain-containing protein [Photobacterium sp. DA100]WEM44670.1 CHASE2 domain-containing protein [Photobacterium sp. DA100]